MTKKDYIKFANALAGLRPIQTDLETKCDFERRLRLWRKMIERIAEIFASDNPRFDRERFLKTIGY